MASFVTQLGSASLHFYPFLYSHALWSMSSTVFDSAFFLGKCVDSLHFIKLSKLGELKLEELLDSLPPGLDEAIAISKACSANDSYCLCKRW